LAHREQYRHTNYDEFTERAYVELREPNSERRDNRHGNLQISNNRRFEQRTDRRRDSAEGSIRLRWRDKGLLMALASAGALFAIVLSMKTLMLLATGIFLAFVCAFVSGWLGLPVWFGALIAITLTAVYFNFGRQ
jgi:hypothetical protein